jgi:outer membrane protein assembly factor BamB
MKRSTPFIITALVLATQSVTLKSADWPRWRGPGADARWNPANVPENIASSTPERLWTQKISGGYGGVTVSAGRVYVMDYSKTPQEKERVLCLDAASGEKQWEHTWPVTYGDMDYANGPRSSVVIDASGKTPRAYTLGATGVAACFDAQTGSVLWQVDTQKEKGAKVPTWGFAASPFLRGDAVILHVAAQPGGCLLALDKDTGKEIWRGGDDPAGYCTPELIRHRDHEQLIAWGPEHVQSLDPDKGTLNWRHPYKITYGVSIAQPLYADGTLLISGYWHGSKAFALGDTPGDYKLLWENEKDLCGLMSAPLHKNGLVYLLDKNHGLTCLELKTGKILWQDGGNLTPKERNPHMSLVWLDEKNDLVALLNARGELVYARITAKGAEELARHQILGKTWAHPAFAGDKIFARSDTEICAWRLW